MKRFILLIVLASLLAACESAGPRGNPPYDRWLECEKTRTGRAAGTEYNCAR